MGRADHARMRVGEQHRSAVGGADADAEPRRLGHDGVGARPVRCGPRRVGDDDVRRMDLVDAEKVLGPHADRRRHARAVLGDFRGRVFRAQPAVQAFVEAVGHAARAGEKGVADAGQGGQRARLQHCRCCARSLRHRFEARHRAQVRMADGDRLEQLAHAGAGFAQQPLAGLVDLVGLLGRRIGLQRRGALVDAEVAQQPRLIDRSVNARAHAFGGQRDRLEVDMGGEIDLAGRHRAD